MDAARRYVLALVKGDQIDQLDLNALVGITQILQLPREPDRKFGPVDCQSVRQVDLLSGARFCLTWRGNGAVALPARNPASPAIRA